MIGYSLCYFAGNKNQLWNCNKTLVTGSETLSVKNGTFLVTDPDGKTWRYSSLSQGMPNPGDDRWNAWNWQDTGGEHCYLRPAGQQFHAILQRLL